LQHSVYRKPEGGLMGANQSTWLSAHGRLWYDDRWYRIAWIVWPQALAVLGFVSLWMPHPASQPALPWAKPLEQKQPVASPGTGREQTATPPQLAQSAEALSACSGTDASRAIQGCSVLLASGNLRGRDVAGAYWRRGWAYYSSKQYEQAMGDYDRAIALEPRVPEFYNDRGVLWMELQNTERAMQDFDQAILIKPDYGRAFLNRGIGLRNLKRPNEALVALSSAISFDPNLWLAYEHRAFIYEERFDWRAMYDDANKLTELRPDYRMGYEFRGHAYLEVGQYQAAINDFTKAINLDSSAVYGWRMRGRAYYFLNQYDAAASDYQVALRIDPKDSSTISFINELLRKQRGR
jgi:tetratricopeptide (TPR) repeat protein